MVAQTLSQPVFVTMMAGRLGTDYTDEQRELIYNTGDGPLFCFADPGTGKTHTAVAALLNAEIYKQIPGNNIYAMSFTRLSTGELSVRHAAACKKLGVKPYVHFQTLHSLCLSILTEHYSLLGMTSFKTTDELSMEQAFDVVQAVLDENGAQLQPATVRRAISACRELNAALTFGEEAVRSKMAFKSLGIDYDLFELIRGNLFAYNYYMEKITVSDLLLYTVILMTRHPEVSAEFKKKCRLLLVDEAQDLSLLQLRVISMLSDNVVVIGDMKQQIYAFNGACQEIVEAFHDFYPTVKSLQLTQSFRCKSAIADWATKIIMPNKIGGEAFKGVSTGGEVILHNGFYEEGADIESIAVDLRSEFISNKNQFKNEIMFLARSNVALIPIIEELYKQKLPFRVNKFQPAYDIPLVKELVAVLQLAQAPYEYSKINSLAYLIPELKGYGNYTQNPLYKFCKMTGCSIFDGNYQFRDAATAGEAMGALMEAVDMIKSGANTGDIFNKIWPVFYESYVKPNIWKLENKPEYYLGCVNHLTRKPFNEFIMDEAKKKEIALESDRYQRGVRCYTMHASKGLEADIVYIMDADDGVMPNAKKLDQTLRAHCELDAARMVREERSLAYVACTRAKSELHIIYNGRDAAPILRGVNPYSDLDLVYETCRTREDNVEAFDAFVGRYITA